VRLLLGAKSLLARSAASWLPEVARTKTSLSFSKAWSIPPPPRTDLPRFPCHYSDSLRLSLPSVHSGDFLLFDLGPLIRAAAILPFVFALLRFFASFHAWCPLPHDEEPTLNLSFPLDSNRVRGPPRPFTLGRSAAFVLTSQNLLPRTRHHRSASFQFSATAAV